MVTTVIGKPGKWESIFQSGDFKQTGKVVEFIRNAGKVKEF